MNQILTFLSGKKSIIVGIIATTISFLVLKGILDIDTATFINAITLLIFGSASIATTQMYKSQQ
jgi:hypothetical protein